MRALRKGGLKENILWLSALQALNYLLPLATVPYLIRVLGPKSYGALAFTLAFTQYLVILADYGFNLSATREVAIRRQDQKGLEELVSAVFTVKAAFLFLAAIILTLFLMFVPRRVGNPAALMIAFLSVVGTVMFPVWLFQGLEDMRLATILSAVAKIICTMAIFVTVHTASDVLSAVLWTVAGSPVAGLAAWVVIVKRYQLKLHKVSLSMLSHTIRSGFHVFISNIMTTLLTTGAILVMGFLAPTAAVGVYAAIEKIAKAAAMGFSPLTQALYPRTVIHFSEGDAAGRRFVVHSGVYILTMALLASILLAVTSKWVIHLICGAVYVQYSDILHILSIWLFFGVVNNIIGIQYLLGSGRDRTYSACFTIAAVVTLGLLLSLVPSHLYYGAAIAMTGGEILLTLSMIVIITIDLCVRSRRQSTY